MAIPFQTIQLNLGWHMEPNQGQGVMPYRGQVLDLLSDYSALPPSSSPFLLSMRLGALKQMLSQGTITSRGAWSITARSLGTWIDGDLETQWSGLERDFISRAVEESPYRDRLQTYVQERGHTEEAYRAVEFFLRGGALGLRQFQAFEPYMDRLSCHQGWSMSSFNLFDFQPAPESMRREYGKAAWLVAQSMSAQVLIGDPPPLEGILVGNEGMHEFGSRSIFARIDLSQVGPIDSTLRAEMGHRQVGYVVSTHPSNRAAHEFIDRVHILDYASRNIENRHYLELYRELFDAFRSCFEWATAHRREAIAAAERFLDGSSDERVKYFLGEAIRGLKQGDADPFAQKIIGEGVAYLLALMEEERPVETTPLFERTLHAYEAIDAEVPVDMRTFFEGGYFLSTNATHNRELSWPAIESVPRYPLLTPRFHVERETDPHIPAEWLDFMLRQRIASLLASGDLEAGGIKPFYLNGALYAASLQRGNLFDVQSLGLVIRNLTPQEVDAGFSGLMSDGVDQKKADLHRILSLERAFREGEISFEELVMRVSEEGSLLATGSQGVFDDAEKEDRSLIGTYMYDDGEAIRRLSAMVAERRWWNILDYDGNLNAWGYRVIAAQALLNGNDTLSEKERKELEAYRLIDRAFQLSLMDQDAASEGTWAQVNDLGFSALKALLAAGAQPNTLGRDRSTPSFFRVERDPSAAWYQKTLDRLAAREIDRTDYETVGTLIEALQIRKNPQGNIPHNYLWDMLSRVSMDASDGELFVETEEGIIALIRRRGVTGIEITLHVQFGAIEAAVLREAAGRR